MKIKINHNWVIDIPDSTRINDTLIRDLEILMQNHLYNLNTDWNKYRKNKKWNK